MIKQLVDAKLGETLQYLKHPEYGASFLIVERPSGLEGLKGVIDGFLGEGIKQGLLGINRRESDRFYSSHKTDFLSFWKTTAYLQDPNTKKVPVINDERPRFKAEAIRIIEDTLHPKFDRDDVAQSFVMIARLRKNRVWQNKLYNQVYEKLSELSNGAREIARFALNSDHFVVATAFEKA